MTISVDQTSLDARQQAHRRGMKAALRMARVPRSTFALLAISIILPLALFALAALQNGADVEKGAELRVERTTRILHEQALKVFETHQLMIDQLNERMRDFDWGNAGRVAELDKRLAHLKALMPQVTAIAITDAAGNLRASSVAHPKATNFADREWFEVLKASDPTLPFISATTNGKLTGRPVFNVAARIRTADPNTFDGVIAVSIDQAYFVDFYRETEREYDHLVVLARDDGSVLATESTVPMTSLPSISLFKDALRNGAQGFHIGPSVVDGHTRIFGYEKVGPYPVVIGFGITQESALAPWRRNMMVYGVVAALSSLTLLGVSGFAIRRVTLEGRATVRWRHTAARLEAEMIERQNLEGQLRQAQKMEAVGRLTGGIAHDFNNLLTVVIGSLDLLARRMGDADQRQVNLVRSAIDGASRAANLTARLLAFSRQHPLDPKPVDANALIEEMSSLLQRTLSATVAINYRFEESPWQTYVDPNQLENAILNLCVNAVDAMPRGGTLTLSTANATLDEPYVASHDGLAAGPYVRISITDTGTGMTPEVMHRAFEPFYTTKPVGKGTGLGLSQVYGFARQSGGHAAIRSELGTGTTIEIYLPRLSAASPAKTPDADRIKGSASSAMPSSIRSTILIVEDDDLVRQFSASALRDAGYVVLEASTGPDGLAMLSTQPDIALLFTDIVLKGPLDGREMVKKARVLRPDLPVLFTTGYTKDALPPMGDQDRSAAAADFIEKPFTAAAVAVKIADLLRHADTQTRVRAAG